MIRRIWLAAALLGTALLGLSTLSASADPRTDMLGGISRCASLPDDRTFLDCVYGAAQPMRAKLGLPSAPAFQVQLVPPAPGGMMVAPPTASMPPAAAYAGSVPPPPSPPQSSAATQKTSGLFGGLFDNGSEETERMASYKFNPRGQFTLTLSNGQVWRQRSNDTAFATWGAKPSEYYVTVRAVGSGGYNLSVRGDDGIYQVEPVR